MSFLLQTMDDGSYDVEPNTIFMEVGARKRLGLAVAARSFGKDSEFNATGMPEARSTHNTISRSICIGCQSAGAVAEIWPALRRVIIVTSSNIICDGANKIFDWFKDGFPSSLPGGMTKEGWVLLHHNMKTLEDKVWKVDPEYIVHAMMLAWDRFIELGLAPADGPGICRCPGCVQKKQLTELSYARTGVVDCCDCPHAQSLINRNLKRGDEFVITNNAGVTEPTTTMQVDGGSMFRDRISSDK